MAIGDRAGSAFDGERIQAQSPRYQMIHEGRHWTWFARQDQFRKHKADIEALYKYADTAFDKLCESWGLKPPKDRYTLLVMAARRRLRGRRHQ